MVGECSGSAQEPETYSDKRPQITGFSQTSNIILTQVKFPSWGPVVNKRLIPAWKTLAFFEPDSAGEVPRFDSNVGDFYREGLGKCWEINWQLRGMEHRFLSSDTWRCEEWVLLSDSVIKHNLKSFQAYWTLSHPNREIWKTSGSLHHKHVDSLLRV